MPDGGSVAGGAAEGVGSEAETRYSKFRLPMLWLILFSPAIVYSAILGLSELGILGVSQETLRLHIATAGLLQSIMRA